MNKKIHTEKAPAALGPYSQGVQTGSTLYTSGQLGMKDGVLPEGIVAQATQSLENVKAILNEAGYEMSDIVKTLVFLADIKDFAAFNEIYAKYINGPVLPARSCVQVAALPKGALCEVEVIAIK